MEDGGTRLPYRCHSKHHSSDISAKRYNVKEQCPSGPGCQRETYLKSKPCLIRQRRTRVNSPLLAALQCLCRYPAALRRGSSFGLALLLMLALFVTVLARAENKGAKLLLLSSSPDSPIQLIRGIENGALSLEKDVTFKVKAYIEPVTVSKKVIYTQKELPIEDKRFICKDYPCERKWEFDFSDQPVSVAEFPNLQLTWSQALQDTLPEIWVDAKFRPKDKEQDSIYVIKYFSGKHGFCLRPRKTLDMKGAEYKKKSWIYLAKRQLGFKGDDRWHYSKEKYGDNLAIQRRIHMPLKDIQVVQVVSEMGRSPEQVNFSVDLNGDGRWDDFIRFEKIEHTQGLSRGRSVLTLDLRGALKDKDIDPEKAVLMETIIFLATDFQTYLRNEPIYKIIFAGAGKTVERRGRHYSLEFDLSKSLEEQPVWHTDLVNLTVTVCLDGPQIFSMEKVRLFDTWDQQVPLVTQQPKKAFVAWTKNSKIIKRDETDSGDKGDNGQDLNVSVRPNVEEDETIQTFHEEIKAFRPLWAQIYREDLPMKAQSTAGAFLIAPYGEHKTSSSPGGYWSRNRGVGNKHIKRGRIIERQWCSSDAGIRGIPYCSVSGVVDESIIRGEMTIEQREIEKTVPVYFSNNFKSLTSYLTNGTQIKDIHLNSPFYIDEGPVKLDVALLDIQTRKSGEAYDYRGAEWWLKDAEVPLSVNRADLLLDDKGEKIFVFPQSQDRNKFSFTFTLPDKEFMLPVEFIFPGPLPQPCLATLKFGAHEVAIPYGPYTLSLLPFGSIAGDFKLSIEYLGNEQLIVLPVPKFKVMGLKQTPHDDLKRLGLIIDEKKSPVQILRLPEPKGEWFDLGSVSLGPGSHTIRTVDIEYFRFKTVVFHSDTLLPWPEEGGKAEKAVSLWQKFLQFGIKLLIFVAIVTVAWFFRVKIRVFLQIFLRPIREVFGKTYWRLSDKVWVVVWGLVGLGLYSLAQKAWNMGFEENYAFSFGGIAVVFVFWHLSRACKSWFISSFPKAAEYVYRGRGTPFIAGAIALLIVTAFALALQLEPLAEQVAVIVYYLLVVGIVGEVIALKRGEQVD